MRIGLPSRLDRRRQRQKGSVAVEFAIVGGWLIVVLGAIIETGIFLIVQFNLQNAAETAGRKIRTNQFESTPSISDFKTEICAGIAIADCENKVYVDVQNDSSFTGLAAKIPFKTNEAPQVGPDHTETFDPGAPDRWGSLIVTYDWKFNFPLMDRAFGNLTNGNRRLFGLSIYKNEK
jgi:hypothetical protein